MGRPSTPILSPDRIALAAVDLVDSAGDLTMASLAGRLGVRPSSLYNHVTGKDEIVELMRVHVFAGLETEVYDGESWDAALVRMTRSYRDCLGDHPRLIPLLTTHTIRSPILLQAGERLVTLLRSAGVPQERLLEALSLVDVFALGAALDLAAPDEVWDASVEAAPALRAAIAAAPVGRVRAERTFEHALRGLVFAIQGLVSASDATT